MMYELIGLMSGTSMDGLDLCHCTLQLDSGRWSYQVLRTRTVPYSAAWRQRLDEAIKLGPSTGELEQLDQAFAHYVCDQIEAFGMGDNPELIIASHGHTVHHVPKVGYTRQIGDPQIMADRLLRTVVGDFRSGDVALGGQGAPLVPVADRLLFGDYTACVNLGGFANVSFELDSQRIAGDVSVCNLLFDRLAAGLGARFDAGGAFAAQGKVLPALLAQLDRLPFFAEPMPKSLGREWFEREVWPLYAGFHESAEAQTDPAQAYRDALATAVHQLAKALAQGIQQAQPGQVLVTGGGAYNDHLLGAFRQNLPPGYRVGQSAPELIDYKEALAFALLAVLRLRGETNTLRSVTGARVDSSGGQICQPSIPTLMALA